MSRTSQRDGVAEEDAAAAAAAGRRGPGCGGRGGAGASPCARRRAGGGGSSRRQLHQRAAALVRTERDEDVLERRRDRGAATRRRCRAPRARRGAPLRSPRRRPSTVTCTARPNIAAADAPPGRPAAPRPRPARRSARTSRMRLAEPARSAGGRVERDQPAAVHQRQPVAVLGLLHVVGGDEHRGAAARRARRSGPRSCGATSGSTPDVGSSRKRIGGSCSTAQPSARRCFQPSGELAGQAPPLVREAGHVAAPSRGAPSRAAPRTP